MRIVRARQTLSNVDWAPTTGKPVSFKEARFDHRPAVPVTKEQIAEAKLNYQTYNTLCKDPHANLKYWPLWNEPFWDDPAHERVNNCIIAGTPVSLANGTSIAIEKIQVGDAVLAYDKKHRGLVIRTVAECMDQGEKPCIELRFVDGRILVCTTDHRILSNEGTWIAAGKLVPGTSSVAVVRRVEMAMPILQLQLIETRDVGVQHVYDLSVPAPGGDEEASFVANGITVHNCLAYALMDRDDIQHRQGKPQPGDVNGCPDQCPDLTDDDYTNHPAEIVRRLRRDFNTEPHELIFPEDENTDPHVPPCGYYKAALLIAKQNNMFDYHFVRQDSNGFWSHKPGSTPVENVDASGRLITNPETADFFYDPHNKGTGYNYQFYRYIFVKANAPSRVAIMKDNLEHANKRYALRPDIFYDPHHPARVPAVAAIAAKASAEILDDRAQQQEEEEGAQELQTQEQQQQQRQTRHRTGTGPSVRSTSITTNANDSAESTSSPHTTVTSFFTSLFHRNPPTTNS